VDEVTSCTLQRHNEDTDAGNYSPDDQHMDVHRSSSDSDPDSRRLHGTIVLLKIGYYHVISNPITISEFINMS